MEVVNTLGRRKSAVARVYVSEGKGNIIINNRELNVITSYSIHYTKLYEVDNVHKLRLNC